MSPIRLDSLPASVRHGSIGLLALLLAVIALPPVTARAQISKQAANQALDQAGIVRVARGRPILIGGVLVLSGPELSAGLDTSRGIEIALAEHKSMLVGHPIKYLPEDGACSVAGGQAAAARLAANKQMVGVLGMSCTAEAVGGAPILSKAGIPVAVTGATAATLTAPDRAAGLQSIVRFVYNDNDAAMAAVNYARSLGVTRAATLDDGSIYSTQLAQSFGRQFAASGGTVVAAETVSSAGSDLRPVLRQIGAARPTLLFAPIYIDLSNSLLRQIKEFGSIDGVALLGTDVILTPAFLDVVGQAAVGVRMLAIDRQRAAVGTHYGEFLELYRTRFGDSPISSFHANGYNAASAMMAAIEAVATTDAEGTTMIDRGALLGALMRTADLDGISGRVTCNRYGDCGSTEFAVFEYTDGARTSFEMGTNPKRVFP